MAKLHIVCPSCNTKYPVADDKLAGRRVTCKKCSEKFVAEIQGAAAPPPPKDDFSLSPADDPFASSTSGSDPFGGDLFGDFASSESATAAPSLGALPAKQKSSSSGGFDLIPILLGSARVFGVSIVVIIAFSTLFGTPGSSQGSSPGNNVSGGPHGQRPPWNDRGFGPPQNQGGGRNEGAFTPPRNQGGASDEGIYVPPADGPSSNPPFSGSSPDQYEPSGNRPFDGPSANARRAAEDEYRRAMENQRNQRPMGRPSPPPPGMMPNWGPSRRPSGDEFRRQLEKDYGNKLVRLEHKKISVDQTKEIGKVLGPMMINMSYSSFFDPKVDSYVFLFPYDGDLNELASKITFGEVEEVLVGERRIRMKSITIP